MGCCVSQKSREETEDLALELDTKMEESGLYNVKSAMHEAIKMGGFLAPNALEHKIRLAKQSMKTITVINGCLFIDYKFEGKISG